MKNIFFLPVMLAIFLCAANSISAQENRDNQSLQSADTLTWQQCVGIAQKNNQQYKIAQANFETAKSSYNLALNKYSPSANLQYGYQRSNYDNLTDKNLDWSGSVNVSQNLFNWEAISSIRIQKENLNLAQAQLRQASAAVRYSLRTAYLAMLYAQENIDLYKNIYDIRKKSADMIRLQYEGGNESKGNTMRADALAFAANNNIKNAEGNLVAARQNLVVVLGREQSNDFMIKDELNVIDAKTIDINSAVETAPQIIISGANLRTAELQVSSSKTGILPSLTASGSVGLQGDNPALADGQNFWDIGVLLSYPVFSGGITAAKENIDIAKSALTQSQQTLAQQYLAVKAQLQSVLSAIDADLNTIESNKLLLASAEQMDKEANIEYLSGLMDFQIWQSVEQDLVNYKSAYLSSIYNANTDEASRDNILGLGLGD